MIKLLNPILTQQINYFQQLKDIFMQELKVIFPEVINKHIRHLESQLDLEKIVN